MKNLREIVIYGGVALFVVHAYINSATAADREWLRTLAQGLVMGLWTTVADILSLAAGIVSSAVLWLLGVIWGAAAPYLVDVLLIGGVVAVGLAIFLYAIHSRDAARGRIAESVEELEGLV
jgi:hypothetical protein